MLTDVSMKSLRGKLDEDGELLQHVAQVWSIDQTGQDAATTRALLLERTGDPIAARSVWERLSPNARLCLFHTFGSGNPFRKGGLTRESLRKKTKLSLEEFSEAILSLKDRWYLVDEEALPSNVSALVKDVHASAPELIIFPFRECVESLWRTGQELFRASADRTLYQQQHFLSIMHQDQLQRLAHLCHVQTHSAVSTSSYNAHPSISHPLEVHKRVYEAMQHPLIPFELLHRLDPEIQRVFLWLCEQEEGKARMDEVRAYLASPQETEAKVLRVVQALEAHALAFDTLTRKGVRWLFVPRDLLEVVKREVHEATLDERRYVFAPVPWSPMWQNDGQPTMFYDLATSIGLMFQTEISLTMDGKVPKRLHGKWRPLFYGRARMSAESGEDLYLDQVFEASKEMGLLSAQAPTREEKRRYMPGPKLVGWTESTLVEQGQMLLQWWAKSSSWLDVQPDGKLISSTTARKTLLEHLAHCVTGCWFAVDALLYALWRQAPLYLYDPYRRRLSKPTSLRSLREQWMQREGMMYIGLLGTLAEFGVLSLGSTTLREHREEVVPDLFCLTKLGAALLAQTPSSLTDTFPERGTPSLIVQPNFDVLLLQFQIRLVYQLLPFATLQRIGPVSTFRLTKPALLRGLAHGHRIEQILAFFSEYSQKGLPQNVAYTLKDWVRSYKEAHLEEVILIELSGEQAEDNLYRTLSERAIVPRKLAPGIFVVEARSASFYDLRSRLEKGGIVVRGEPATRRYQS